MIAKFDQCTLNLHYIITEKCSVLRMVMHVLYIKCFVFFDDIYINTTPTFLLIQKKVIIY